MSERNTPMKGAGPQPVGTDERRGAEGTKVVVVTRGDAAGHAGVKAPADVSEICSRLGFETRRLRSFTEVSWWRRLVSVASSASSALWIHRRLGDRGVLLVQHPIGRLNAEIILRTTGGSPRLCLVHDLDSLRQPRLASREVAFLRCFDALIVHNAAMAEHLAAALPATPLIPLDLFDYLIDGADFGSPVGVPQSPPKQVYVIANLSEQKAGYLYALDSPAVPLTVYGGNCSRERLPAGIDWRGTVDMHRPLIAPHSGFGLAWDGSSPDRLDGAYGRYLAYSSPHKVSLYLALGLPVIVSAASAIADLVASEQLGFVVDSVASGLESVRRCSEDEWMQMCAAVDRRRARILKGEHTQAALREALRIVGADAGPASGHPGGRTGRGSDAGMRRQTAEVQ